MVAEGQRLCASLVTACGTAVRLDLRPVQNDDGNTRLPPAVVGWVAHVTAKTVTLLNAASFDPDGGVIAPPGTVPVPAPRRVVPVGRAGQDVEMATIENASHAPEAALTEQTLDDTPRNAVPCLTLQLTRVAGVKPWSGQRQDLVSPQPEPEDPARALDIQSPLTAAPNPTAAELTAVAGLWVHARVRRFVVQNHGTALTTDTDDTASQEHAPANGAVVPQDGPVENAPGNEEAELAVRQAAQCRKASHAAVPLDQDAVDTPLGQQLRRDVAAATALTEEGGGPLVPLLCHSASGGTTWPDSVRLRPGDPVLAAAGKALAGAAAQRVQDATAEALRTMVLEESGWVQSIHRPQPRTRAEMLLDLQLTFVRRLFLLSVACAVAHCLIGGITVGAAAVEILTQQGELAFVFVPYLWYFFIPPGITGVVLGIQLAGTTDVWQLPTRLARKVSHVLELSLALLLLPGSVLAVMSLLDDPVSFTGTLSSFYDTRGERSDNALCRFQMDRGCTGYRTTCLVSYNGTALEIFSRPDCPVGCTYTRSFLRTFPTEACGGKIRAMIRSSSILFTVCSVLHFAFLAVRNLGIELLFRYFRRRALAAVRLAIAEEERYARAEAIAAGERAPQ